MDAPYVLEVVTEGESRRNDMGASLLLGEGVRGYEG